MSVVVIIAVVAVVALLLFGVSRVTAIFPQLKGAGFERSVSGKLRRLPEEYCVIDNAVFVSNGASTQIDHIVVSPSGVYHLLDVIRGYREVRLSEGLRARIIEMIQANRATDHEALERHKSFARGMRAESDRRVMDGRCPRCGGELVRREGRYGSFWGCSNYPSCKYILKGRDRW